MVSPKDRVRANIYKKLLEEEKIKNKRKNILSVSLFIVGIFTTSTFQLMRTTPEKNSFGHGVLASNVDSSNKKITELSLEHLFNNSYLEDKNLEIDTDDLFGLNSKI